MKLRHNTAIALLFLSGSIYGAPCALAQSENSFSAGNANNPPGFSTPTPALSQAESNADATPPMPQPPSPPYQTASDNQTPAPSASAPWPSLPETSAGQQQTITSKPGVNYVIPVSGLTTNLIVTPFSDPTIITPMDGSIKTTMRGDQIFFTLESTHPVGVFVTGSATDPSISLTLIPKQIPGQTYFLSIPGYVPQAASKAPLNQPSNGPTSASAPAPTAPDASDSDYVSQITSGLIALAKGENPDGYNETTLSVGPVQHGPLSLSGQNLWIGNGNSIAVFKVTNTTSETIPLVENDLYQKGVLAVSFFPNTNLIPGQSTTAYVVFQNTDHTGFGTVWQN